MRQAACQKAALRQAACLRGRGEKPDFSVELVTVTREEYIRQAAEQAEQRETEEDGLFRRGLALIGMTPTNSSAADRGRAGARLVGAYYSSASKRITVLDCGSGFDTAGSTALLVHEMIHALQDRAGELLHGAVRHDEQLAMKAIREGEATLLQDEALAEGLGYAFDDIDYGKVLDDYRRGELFAARRAHDPMSELGMHFHYAEGASYLWPTRRDRGPSKLRDAFLMPAVSSYAIMTHDVRKSQARPDELGESAVPVLPDLTFVGSLHLGRFGYEVASYVFARKYGTRRFADGQHFTADTFSVFTTPAQVVLASWRIRFDDEEQAHLTAGRLANVEAPMRSGVDGRDVWIIVSENQSGLDDVPEAPEWVAAPGEDFGYEADSSEPQGTLHCMLPRFD